MAWKNFPVLDARSLRDLRQLIVDFEAPFPDLTGDEVEHLTNLQQVKLSGELYAGMEEAEIPQGDTPGRKFRIPANLFRANTLLRSVHIDIDGRGRGDYNFTVSVPHRLVSHLDYLESLSIYDPHVEGHRPGMAPLELASESPLAKHLKVPESMPKGWQNTKQFMDLERWSNWSNGYELLVFTGDDDWIDLGN